MLSMKRIVLFSLLTLFCQSNLAFSNPNKELLESFQPQLDNLINELETQPSEATEALLAQALGFRDQLLAVLNAAQISPSDEASSEEEVSENEVPDCGIDSSVDAESTGKVQRKKKKTEAEVLAEGLQNFLAQRHLSSSGYPLGGGQAHGPNPMGLGASHRAPSSSLSNSTSTGEEEKKEEESKEEEKEQEEAVNNPVDLVEEEAIIDDGGLFDQENQTVVTIRRRRGSAEIEALLTGERNFARFPDRNADGGPAGANINSYSY